MYLITSHLNTDFDSLASMVAISKLYPDAVICPPGSMDRKVKDYMTRNGHLWNITKPKKVKLDDVDLMVVVDARSRQRIGIFSALADRPDKVAIHVYDHHPPTLDDLPAEEIVCEPVGAAVTMIFEHLLQEKKAITPEEATLFALGIYDDTGALTYDSTTERDIAALEYLKQLGADLSQVLLRVESAISSEDRHILDALAENARESYINGAKVFLSFMETEEYVQGLSLFVQKLKDYCAAHVTIIVVNNGGKKINIIARSAPDVLNVKKFLEPYGGSGHLQAGSATVTERDPVELLDEIEARLYQEIPPMLKVSDIMDSPVIAVDPDSKVDEAYRTMLRFRLKSLPVANSDGEVLGMMTRTDLDRAHLHGLDKARISDFMTRGVITLDSDASIDEAHRIVAMYGFEKMPVLENGKLAGTLTRADLLRALYRSGQFARKNSQDKKSDFMWRENIAHLMQDSFPDKTLALLKRLGAKAESMGMRAYLVGGTVRDILMGVENTDIDISVEGDAEKLVRAWDEPGCKSTVHGHYNTGTITFPDGEKVDVATARREFYEHAGATPIVRSDSLKQDLGRRDFTVNAMSISLSENDWGTLTDSFGGRTDLRDGLLRILHNLSFVEDPSRILRGIRLEQRLKMTFEDNTLRFLKSAVKGGLLECLSTPRIRAELELNAKEKCFNEIALRMQELNIWQSLFPGIYISERFEKRLNVMKSFLQYFRKNNALDLKNLEWILKMAIVLHDSEPEIKFATMDRLSLHPAEREELTKCFSKWDVIKNLCERCERKDLKNSEAYSVLKDYNSVPLIYWLICLDTQESRSVIFKHIEKWQNLKGELNGGDLQKMGLKGKTIGEVLNEIKLEKIDGKLTTRDSEIEYVKEFIEQYFIER